MYNTADVIIPFNKKQTCELIANVPCDPADPNSGTTGSDLEEENKERTELPLVRDVCPVVSLINRQFVPPTDRKVKAYIFCFI